MSPVVTASVGAVSASGVDLDDPLGLVEAADACLYQSKAQGRNRVSGGVLPRVLSAPLPS